MSRSGNYSMLTQVQERLKVEGKDPRNISLLSRETGLSRDTVRKYINDGVQPHGNRGKKKGSKLDEFKEYLKEQFACNNFNCEALFDRMRSRGYSGGITIIREYVKRFRPDSEQIYTPGRTMRFETQYGEQVQMDWGFVFYLPKNKKKLKKIACLVMVCGASRMRYVEFFTTARQEFLFIGMIHAFQYFEGLFQAVLTDNMKSVVHSRNKLTVVFNAKYEAFMAELGFATRLCKVRTPQTKGKSERLVDYVKDNFFPGRSFTDLIDLNVQALQWCEQVNDKEHGTTGQIPSEVHVEEKEHLKVLPSAEILDRYLWVARSVNIDGMVSYEGSKFGIVHSCHEKRVSIARFHDTILIKDSQGELVGSYEMASNRKNYYHPQQWPHDYRRDNGGGKKKYGHAIQQEYSLFEDMDPTDFSDYDAALRGGF